MFATRNNRYNNNRNTGIPSQSNNFTATVLVQKSYKDHTVKSQLFIFVPLLVFMLVLTPDSDSSQDLRKVIPPDTAVLVVKEFSKIQNLTKL